MKKLRHSLLTLALALPALTLLAQEPVPPPLPVDSTGEIRTPETDSIAIPEADDPTDWAGEGAGMSGVYEMLVGVTDLDYAIRYFSELGFRLVGTGYLNKLAAQALYGVPSGVKSYRLQNGKTDSHGLVRLLVWEQPLGPGVGYSEPGTIGSRMAGILTTDIFRLYDIYSEARKGGEPWLVRGPVSQDMLGDGSAKSFFERPVTTRELAVYGSFCNHLYFQRYGYTVPGYGNIHMATRLATSEITHHDLFVKVDSMAQLRYLETVLGLEADGDASLNGEWMDGPTELYGLEAGETYWFQSFQSVNNIAGKLRFFVPTGGKPDRSARQRPGYEGITGHTFFTPYLDKVWADVAKAQLRPTPILPNEFGERCFVFRGPEGNTWQVLERKTAPLNEPIFHQHMQLLDE